MDYFGCTHFLSKPWVRNKSFSFARTAAHCPMCCSLCDRSLLLALSAPHCNIGSSFSTFNSWKKLRGRGDSFLLVAWEFVAECRARSELVCAQGAAAVSWLAACPPGTIPVPSPSLSHLELGRGEQQPWWGKHGDPALWNLGWDMTICGSKSWAIS